MTRLAAEGVTVRRGSRAILDDVSLDLEGGCLVGLLGPNGAGKSTLLSVLAGLLRPDAGTVLLDGQPLDRFGRRALAKRRAYLPQNPHAEWPVSVERLVALGLTPQLPVFGGLAGEMQRKVDAAIEQFDMARHRDQPVTTLSGGNWRARCWPARWSASPACCWPTSRSPGSTRATRWRASPGCARWPTPGRSWSPRSMT